MIFVDIFRAYPRSFRKVQVTQLNGHLHIIDHATANQGHKAIIAYSGIYYLLYTRDQGCKGRNDDTPGCVGKDFIERVIDDTLGWRVTRRLHARAITHHYQYALV